MTSEDSLSSKRNIEVGLKRKNEIARHIFCKFVPSKLYLCVVLEFFRMRYFTLSIRPEMTLMVSLKKSNIIMLPN